ncbi:MAG: ATP-binding protein [Nanoarchaeota archaeon]|nr:ATP-binding protein [Nanoarchaeota archaeon]
MFRFIDRKDELAALERDWNTAENAFIVVFGRRRIGKTKLIEQFLRNKQNVRYTAEDASKKVQITELRKILASCLNDEFLASQDINEWGVLFSYLEKAIDKKKKLCIWIDEFSYIIKNDAGVVSVIQKFIDNFVRDSRLFFIVSGSLYGLMSEKVLSNSSPLYGRRTRDLLLKPIPAGFIKEFVLFGSKDSIKTAFTIGGIPEYLNVAARHKSYMDFIRQEFFRHEGYFFREPFFLLSQEFKEIRTYFSILNAIAYGNSKPSNIANFIGLGAREIYPYLELLIAYGFIGRETSVLGDKKAGLYYISDNFFDFWFNFVHKNRELVEAGIFNVKDSELNAYFGKRFEIFIRENFFRFFSKYGLAGRWWLKGEEIDIVALNDKTDEILFGECKWRDNVDAKKALAELKQKASLVEWRKDTRKEAYCIFAKSFKGELKEEYATLYDLSTIAKIANMD